MTIKSERQIGGLLIAGAVAVFLPYTILSIIFEYPDILRQDPGTLLTRFHAGGPALIWVWWAFAVMGAPLLFAYRLIGEKLASRSRLAGWATTIGLISGLAQIIGLLRWTFVVPVLARSYVEASGDAERDAVVMVFQAVHQFGGVLLGEHIGQLLTIAWTVMIARLFDNLGLMPKWIVRFGYLSAAIYLLAQPELFGTVMPGFPEVPAAGLVGSTLWLVWLVLVGVRYLKGLVPDSENADLPASDSDPLLDDREQTLRQLSARPEGITDASPAHSACHYPQVGTAS